MLSMFVTPEVFQLETSASKFLKLLKRFCMSVMAETSQSAMGQYVTVAAAGSASYAWTAVCREALVVKMFCPVQATRGSGGLGDGDGAGGGVGGLGEGGGGDGDGGGGEGDGGEGEGGRLAWQLPEGHPQRPPGP